MIRFRCSHCGKSLQVPEHVAGKESMCPQCHGVSMAPKPKGFEDGSESLEVLAEKEVRVQPFLAGVVVSIRPGMDEGHGGGRRWKGMLYAAGPVIVIILAVWLVPGWIRQWREESDYGELSHQVGLLLTRAKVEAELFAFNKAKSDMELAAGKIRASGLPQARTEPLNTKVESSLKTIVDAEGAYEKTKLPVAKAGPSAVTMANNTPVVARASDEVLRGFHPPAPKGVTPESSDAIRLLPSPLSLAMDKGKDISLTVKGIPAEVERISLIWPDETMNDSWDFLPFGIQRKFRARQVADAENPLQLTIEVKDGADPTWVPVLESSFKVEQGALKLHWLDNGERAAMARYILALCGWRFLGKENKVLSTVAFANEGAQCTQSVEEKKISKCTLPGLWAGGRGVRLTPTQLDENSGWVLATDPLEGIRSGYRLTFTHKVVGTLRLMVSFSGTDAMTVEAGPSDAIPRLERLGKILSGRDDIDQRMQEMRSQIAQKKAGVESLNDFIRRNNDEIRALKAKYTFNRTETFGGVTSSNPELSSTGEVLIRQVNDRIARENKDIMKLNGERTALEGQLGKLVTEKLGPELKTLTAAVLQPMNPLILRVDVPVGSDKFVTIGNVSINLADKSGSGRSSP
jgi:hypothetical protein